MFFFFFKQKTAYEMRISDWSSDVCSSDLRRWRRRVAQRRRHIRTSVAVAADAQALRRTSGFRIERLVDHGRATGSQLHAAKRLRIERCLRRHLQRHRLALDGARSEEHTSELQSLMRISYAVFCLKKKNTQT